MTKTKKKKKVSPGDRILGLSHIVLCDVYHGAIHHLLLIVSHQ